MGYRVWALTRIRHQESFLDHFGSVFNFEYISLVLVLYLPNGALPKIVRLVRNGGERGLAVTLNNHVTKRDKKALP